MQLVTQESKTSHKLKGKISSSGSSKHYSKISAEMATDLRFSKIPLLISYAFLLLKEKNTETVVLLWE